METKVCSKCNRELLANTDNFHKSKRAKDGLRNICKECTNKQNRSYYNPTKKSEYYKEHKEGILASRKLYYINNKDKKLEYDKNRYLLKKEEILAYGKEYRIKNKDKISEKRKNHYENNKDIILSRNRMYYEKNRESILNKMRLYNIENHESIKETNKKYRESPRGKIVKKISEEKRRSLKKQCKATLTKEEWIKIKEDFNNRCAYCGKETECLTMDHFIPLTKHGELTKENIIPCCNSCNSSKNNREFIEWYRKQLFYSRENETHILEFINNISKEI